MNLFDWSMVIFISTLIYYLAIYFTMFRNPSPAKFILVFLIWAVNSFITLVYGMATSQIGFVLMFLLDWAALIVVFSASGKVLKNVDI